ncbi:hypothetical protein N302_09920, partial [Corvus brachyrhynchos]
AAIDFLLLARGHGCDEFEGLCCMDLSSTIKSIHSKIEELRAHIDNLRVEGDDWFSNL